MRFSLRQPYILFLAILPALMLQQCGKPEPQWANIEEQVQLRLITANEGEVIDLPEGHFTFTRGLLMEGKRNLTIRGAGMDKTVLSFAQQQEGAEGFKISNCRNITFEDFTVQDAKGDNFKVSETNGLTFRAIRSQWTGGPKESNGAYGFYPVLCKNVLIENCIAIGASDAGIYVGQSDSVIIRNNIATYNVAGIESENSRWVEIHGNEAYKNTGGILVFDLPGLTQNGHSTRVYKNVVRSNNLKNFAPAGNIVASVPPGTGMMFLATRRVEVFENEITNNRTIGTAIVSYELVKALGEENEEEEEEEGSGEDSQMAENMNDYLADENYDPFPSELYFHSNVYSNSHWFPTLRNDFGKLFLLKFPFSTPDIAIDGILPEGKELNLCLQNNGEFRFANLDAANDFAGLSEDWKLHDCEGDKLPETLLQ